MTKQPPDETGLKCHVTLEEGAKVSVTDAIVTNALAIYGSYVEPLPEGKPKRALVKNRVVSLRSRLGKIMRRLHDLETEGEPEKKLNVDLDLYQMENF